MDISYSSLTLVRSQEMFLIFLQFCSQKISSAGFSQSAPCPTNQPNGQHQAQQQRHARTQQHNTGTPITSILWRRRPNEARRSSKQTPSLAHINPHDHHDQPPTTPHEFVPLLRGASGPLESVLVARFPLLCNAREKAQVKSQKS